MTNYDLPMGCDVMPFVLVVNSIHIRAWIRDITLITFTYIVKLFGNSRKTYDFPLFVQIVSNKEVLIYGIFAKNEPCNKL